MIDVNNHHQGVCISRYDYFLQHRFQMKNDPRRCEQFRTSTVPRDTDVGSKSVVGSYVLVTEMNVNDIYEVNHI